MKVLKLALIGTAALAALSVTARADSLSDLKAQIEALNGRISLSVDVRIQDRRYRRS
jgi:hypothetical protein